MALSVSNAAKSTVCLREVETGISEASKRVPDFVWRTGTKPLGPGKAQSQLPVA